MLTSKTQGKPQSCSAGAGLRPFLSFVPTNWGRQRVTDSSTASPAGNPSAKAELLTRDGAIFSSTAWHCAKVWGWKKTGEDENPRKKQAMKAV